MKSFLSVFALLSVILFLNACNNKKAPVASKTPVTKVQLSTTMGDVVLKLYNETPKHRDNFIQIVNDGVIDSVLFHRVINEFMIQGGDPDSKNAQAGDRLGNGGLDYRVDAEFHPELFHKKGVLAAARDGNPERASSSTQFYIVQGKVFNDSTLALAEKRINNWLAQHFVKKEPTNKAVVDALQKAIDEENMEAYRLYSDSLSILAENYINFESYTIPEEHREVYKTLGGTPHLDQNYTVFGEVLEGIEVVDSIAAVETDSYDRPLTDIRILSAKILDE